jgi:hypothetical protein
MMPYKVLDSQVAIDDMDKRLEHPLMLVTAVLQPLSCAGDKKMRNLSSEWNES